MKNKKVLIGIGSLLILVMIISGGWLFYQNQIDERVEESKKETEGLSRLVSSEELSSIRSSSSRLESSQFSNDNISDDQNLSSQNESSFSSDISSSEIALDIVLKQGSFNGFDDYRASGDVEFVESGDDVLIKLASNFSFSGAPDPVLYLASNQDEREVEDTLILGQLAKNNGEQVYKISRSEYEKYQGSIIIWCRAFDLFMGNANLS